jgi:hypothetical protein
MSCDEIRALFSDVADARLSAAEQAAWDAHLTSCADCRREWASFQRTLELLRGLPRHRAPAGFVNRVMTTVAAPRWPRRLARRLLVPLPVKAPLHAAALALLVVTGVYLVQRTPEMQQAMRDVSPRSGPPPIPAAPPAPAAAPTVAPAAPAQAPAAQAPSPTAVAESPPAPTQSPAAAAQSRAPAPRPESSREERLQARAKPEGKGRADQTAASENAPQKAAEPGSVQTYEAPPAPAPRAAAPSRELYSGGLARQERIRTTAAGGPLLVGRLTVEDREAAGAALAALIASVGATERSRTRVEDGTLIELDVPHARYAEFTRGLAAIGGWTPREERGGPGADVRVRVVVGPPAR